VDRQDELICLGHDEETSAAEGAMMPPSVQTSLFARERLETLFEALDDEFTHAVYSRGRNPTVRVLEAKLAKLERGEAAKCFASGIGAVSAVLLGLLRQGDHVVFANQVYGPTLQLAEHLTGFGVTYTHVIQPDPNAIARAMRPNTRLFFFESPGSMTFRQLDIAGLTAMARERGAITAIDNSWATPLFQKPLTLGVDLVVHSLSKYVGGHSDVIGGAVIGSTELVRHIFTKAFMLNGATPAPFDAFLLIRGLRTLPARLRGHERDALAVARFLASHPAVRQVFHPALCEEEAPLTGRQLTGFSGLFAFELVDDRFESLCRLINALKCFRIGVSWGGVESLVITPNRGNNAEALRRRGIPPGTVRLSVGLEGAQVLIEDLDRALGGLTGGNPS